jgi:multidrug efflux pump
LGGERAFQARFAAKVPLMLFLMLLFLMAQLHSFNRLVLVLSIVPMGLIGIVAALLIFGRTSASSQSSAFWR